MYQIISKKIIISFFTILVAVFSALAISPIEFTQQARLVSGATGDSFGLTVSISGDTAVVTSGNGAYVYVRSGNSWTQQTVLVPSDGISVITFPYPTAISGDTVVIGANSVTVGSNANQGAVYVFARSGTAWSEQQKLTASDGSAGDQLGRSVSISGNTILAGAWMDDTASSSNHGSGYIFVRQNGTWSEQAKLVANDGASNDLLGLTVYIDGDTAALGTGFSRPSVYVFARSGTAWIQQQKLSVCEASANNLCGIGSNGLAISGNTLAVANRNLNVGSNTGAGGVYVFARSGATWTQQQRLTASDGLTDDGFGTGLAIEGDMLVSGSTGGNIRRGSAYHFSRSGSVWTEQQKLQGGASSGFGTTVSISGSKFIVASPTDASGIGAGYVYSAPVARRSAQDDFDGDSKTDISIFRPSLGEWWINRSSTGQTLAAQFGNSADKITPVDFTGDGKTDIAIFRPSTGEWLVLRSEDFSYYSFPFGTSGDQPVPADYDGDGKADAAVFRPASAVWFISKSTGGTTIVQFGANGDTPVVADYDGDGKADIAIFRTSNGQWWLNRSNSGVVATTFGTGTDKPVSGDFTGDGKADIAIWRGSTGAWFVLRSEDSSFFSFPFGASGDIPATGDYDGDGITDPTVYRGGFWYLLQSANGVSIRQFGSPTDQPVPAAFVP